MRLYFMRHGRAANHADWAADDAERPLTSDGRARTLEAARGLVALGIAPQAVISSPFARARETAEIVATEVGIPLTMEPALAPGADLAALASALDKYGEDAELLLVGHEPDLSALIGTLIAGKHGARVEMKKGACACIELAPGRLHRNDHPSAALAGTGTLHWLMTARQLARMAGPSTSEQTGSGNDSDA
jgi:phosphohistidine phosphatase